MLTRFCLLAYCLSPLSVWATTQDVQSNVDHVTIFRDRAEVERLADVELSSGNNTLIFSAIPQSLNTDSLKVSGKGSSAFELMSVQYKTRILEQDVSQSVQALNDQIKDLERKSKVLNRRKERLEAQIELLSEVKLNGENPKSDHVLTPRSAKEIQELLTFVGDNGSKLDTELNAIENDLQETAEKIALLQSRLSQFGSAKKTESIVEVKLNAHGAGRAQLRLGYQVGGASWVPDYNLNRTTGAKTQSFDWETFGNIAQSTGEDWNNVEVVLSTARPQMGIARPALSPIYLNLYMALVREKSAFAAPVAARNASESGMLSKLQSSFDSFSDEKKEVVMQDMAEEAMAEVDLGEVVTYKLSSRLSLKSDGSTERVKISENKLDGSLLNIAVPSRMPQVFMEGKFQNAKLPVLPGVVNVFSNGNFVGKQSVAYIPPAKDFRLSLGVSNEVTIERSKTKDYEDDSGFIRSTRRLKKEYTIRAQNLSGLNQDLVILEAGPVSQNEKITAQLVSQSIPSLDAKDASRIDPTPGILEWHMTLAPQKEQVLTYETAVEFAPDLHVSGIEQL